MYTLLNLISLLPGCDSINDKKLDDSSDTGSDSGSDTAIDDTGTTSSYAELTPDFTYSDSEDVEESQLGYGLHMSYSDDTGFILGAGSPYANSLSGRVSFFRDDDTNPILVLDSSEPSEQMGFFVKNVGDVDSDGINDWGVGAPYSNSGDGRAYIISGAAILNGNNETKDISELLASGEAITIDSIGSETNNMGWSIDSQDFNGDSISDIVMGSNGTQVNIFAGGASLADISWSNRLVTIDSTHTFFGNAVSSATSENGDSLLLISNYTLQSAYLFVNPFSTELTALQDTDADITLESDAVNAGIPVVVGDLLPDEPGTEIAMSGYLANGPDSGQREAGRVDIIFDILGKVGQTLSLPTDSDMTVQSVTKGDWLSYATAISAGMYSAYLMIGAPGSDETRSKEGHVYVFDKADVGAGDNRLDEIDEVFRFEGYKEGDMAGFATAIAENPDSGETRVAWGAPGANEDNGEVYVSVF